jgi:hypothetical protein
MLPSMGWSSTLVMLSWLPSSTLFADPRCGLAGSLKVAAGTPLKSVLEGPLPLMSPLEGDSSSMKDKSLRLSTLRAK